MALDQNGSVKIPKQVLENAEMAEKYIQSLNGKGEGDETDTAAGGSDEEDPEAAAGKEAEGAGAGDGQGAEEEEAGEKPETEDDLEARYNALMQENTTLRQQHSTLQGKYNAEVPRLTEAVQTLQSQMTEKILAQHEAAKSGKPAVETPDAGPSASMLAFIEKHGDSEYAEDLIALIREETGKDLTERFKPIEEEVNTVKKSVEEERNEAYTKKQTEFFTQVQQEMGAADTSFTDLFSGSNEEFNAFLQSADPSGLTTYGEALIGASEKWDAKRMAAVLNAFQGKKPAHVQVEELGKKVEKPAPKKAAPDDTNIAPSRTAPAATAEGDDPIIWTPKALRQLEKDCRSGKLPQEKQDALWADAQKAPFEGRFKDD